VLLYQTLVAVTQAIVQERQAIAQDEQALKGRASEKEQKAIVQKRSRDCTVRISTFVEQRLPLGFLGLGCLQMGSMTIAHLH
jgi:hypothetical protein